MKTTHEWLPVDDTGTAWRFISKYGRVLGTLVKVTDDKYRGRRLCCSKAVVGTSREAAMYVRKSLSNNDCCKQ